MKARKKTVSEKILQEIVRRIVAAVQPEKIILFGSVGREEMGPDSDVDVLVIKPCRHRRRTAWKIERSLIGIGIPTDIVVAKPEDIQVLQRHDRVYLSSGAEGGKDHLCRLRRALSERPRSGSSAQREIWR
jgi:predicted nucleotidyltransferase